VRRRPWLALVVLVLIGINATLFVNGGRRAWRADDPVVFHLDDDRGACPAPVAIDVPLIRITVVAVELPLDSQVVESDAIITLAPKTSPPRG
jgi:hypothetical protein